MRARPANIPPNGVHVDNAVHYGIARHLFGHDGTVSGQVVVEKGEASHAYLIGFRDALSDSAAIASVDAILEMIEQYGAVELEISR